MNKSNIYITKFTRAASLENCKDVHFWIVQTFDEYLVGIFLPYNPYSKVLDK